MTVTSVDKDVAGLSLRLIADFDAPPDRVWELWADPWKLERWWGPPSYPATVQEHDLSPGGGVTYFMTGPDGQRHHGWWQVSSVDAPRSLEFADGFADEHGIPTTDMPATIVRMRLTEHDGGTRMELRSDFASKEEMEQLMTMGMDEGLRQAVGQMDALLAA
jgi:uncharacterized protein YndB with AHSA1/START domain